MARRGRPPHDDVLTPAEWRVCEGVRHGLGNPRIAARLGVSVDAVKYHVANALQKLGFASRRELRHWDGVRASSPLSGRMHAMQEEPMLASLGQVSRPVRDIAAAEVWYRDTLGLKHLYTFGKLGFFDCGGVRLFLCEGEGGAGAESILYFRVDDIHASCAALKRRGVAFLNAPHLIHRHADGSEEWMAFFEDHEGRPLALMARVAPA